MSTTSTICCEGFITIEVKEGDDVVWVEKKKNLVVTSGLNLQRDLLLGTGPTINCLACGQGKAATVPGMLELVEENIRRRFTRIDSQPMKVIYQLVLPASDPGYNIDLSEAGLFAGYSVASQGGNPITGGGVMFSRALFTPITKTTDQSINFTWDIPFTTTGA